MSAGVSAVRLTNPGVPDTRLRFTPRGAPAGPPRITRGRSVDVIGTHFARKLLEHEHAAQFAAPPRCGVCGGAKADLRRRRSDDWYWRCHEHEGPTLPFPVAPVGDHVRPKVREVVVEEDGGQGLHVERVAALDLGKAVLEACVRLPHPGKPGRRVQEVRTYPTRTAQLLKLADWLRCNQVTTVVMESPRSPPWRSRSRSWSPLSAGRWSNWLRSPASVGSARPS